MGVFALILGVLGGMSGVMAILTAVEVVPEVYSELDMVFWFWVAAVLLLASIASLLTRTVSD